MITATPGLEEFEASVMRVCFQVAPAETDLAQLPGDRDRWLLYRSMVRRRLENMIRAALPTFFESLADEMEEHMFLQFFDQRAVRSQYIRDCVPEFVEFIEAEFEDSLSAESRDVIRLERARWIVRDLVCEAEPYGDFDFEKEPVVNPASQALTRDVSDAHAKDTRRHLVVYRDLETMRVREMRMNEFAFRLWDAWSSQDVVAMEAAKNVAESEGLTIDGEFLNRMCDVLAEFVDSGLVLGSRCEA